MLKVREGYSTRARTMLRDITFEFRDRSVSYCRHIMAGVLHIPHKRLNEILSDSKVTAREAMLIRCAGY